LRTIQFATFIFLFVSIFVQSQDCVRIERILVDACGQPEIENEMFQFRVGPNPLNIANMNMTFGFGQPFMGIVTPNSSTASIVNQMRQTIQSCGWLVEPVGGVLPANSRVLVVGSILVNVNANPFTNLSDTLVVIFMNLTLNPDSYFINYAPPNTPPAPNAQTTTISFGNGCSHTVTYLRSQLVTQAGFPGAQDGSSVSFAPDGTPTYYNNGCSAPVNVFSAAWNSPGTICIGSAPVNLNNFLTGTSGGVWSGPGVNGNMFDPSGNAGIVNITYTITIPGCGTQSETNTITLVDCCMPVTFNTIPQTISCTANAIDLIANQNGFASNEAITPCYYVQVNTLAGHTGLQVTFLENGMNLGTLNVSPGMNWSGYFPFASPSANNQIQLCEGASAIPAGNLNFTVRDCHSNAILTTGTWVMDGTCQTVNVTPPGALSGSATWNSNSNGLINVTDWGSAQFSPSAAGPGTWDITYCWDNGSNCQACETKTITVTSNFNAAWSNPGSICTTQGQVDFNTFVTGNTGGTWSGTGITPTGMFNPAGLSGDITITYTVGTGNCAASISHTVQLVNAPDASWNAPASLCQGQTLDLNTLISGNPGGSWTGQGVSGNVFNSAGLNGNVSITYTVGSGTCQNTSTQQIQIVQNAQAQWNGPNSFCADQQINLNQYLNGTGGGTWSGTSVSGTILNTANQSGNIVISYQVGTGFCAANFDVTITIEQQPELPLITGNTVFCEGQQFETLTASGAPGASFSWYSDAGLNNLLSVGNTYTPQGTNLFVIQTVNTCSSVPFQVNFTINSATATPVIPAQFSYCDVNDLPQMTVLNPAGTVQWFSDAALSNLVNSGPSFTPTDLSVLTFWIIQTDGNCPSAVVTTQLFNDDQVTAQIIVNGPLVICEGETVILTSSSPVNNLWSDGSVTQSITVNSAGTYQLQVSGSCNTATDQVTITQENVIADFTLNENIGAAPFTLEILNNSVGSQSCLWTLNNSPAPTLNSGQYVFTEQGSYVIGLECQSPNGCTDRITKTIMVEAAEVQLYVPNAFTPNGDNLNDVFKVYGIGIKHISVQIFSRWGELIHQWDGMGGFWDGTYMNRMVPQGIYSYRIRGMDENAKEIKRIGAVTVLSE
jgi:gliding motility-associated-like protein